MPNSPITTKGLRRLVDSLTDACVDACKRQGTAGEASGTIVLDGDYSVRRDGEIELGVTAGSEIPTDPVEADAKLRWLQKHGRLGAGKLRVEFSVKVVTQNAR